MIHSFGNSALHFSTERFNCCKRLLAFIWQPLWEVKLEPLGKFKYRGTYLLFSLSPKALIMAVDRTGLLLGELWICWSLSGELSFSLEIKSKAFSACFWKGLSLMSSSQVSTFRFRLKDIFPSAFPTSALQKWHQIFLDQWPCRWHQCQVDKWEWQDPCLPEEESAALGKPLGVFFLGLKLKMTGIEKLKMHFHVNVYYVISIYVNYIMALVTDGLFLSSMYLFFLQDQTCW